MSEVRYSVNGKYFKDYGTYISSSEGLFDALKRKPVNTYDWAEYHGSSPDLSKPKFEQREITLKGFVTGANWEVMKSNFDAILSEFQKAGTQRLLIEPLGLKPLPYEVCMIDEVKLQKEFKKGKIVGVFTLKLIEPNPIKKVLYLTGTILNLAYNSPKETEIFYGNGLKETAKGNVSLSGKTLANRVVSGYNFEGRNLLSNSKSEIGGGLEYMGIPIGEHIAKYGVSDREFTMSFDLKSDIAGDFVFYSLGDYVISEANQSVTTEWKRYSHTFRIVFKQGEGDSITYSIYGTYGTGKIIRARNIKLELGNKATDWTPAPEDDKYIVIAGNIEEITNLTTNATVLWEKL